MKQVLILQGWYQKPESNFYPWLKKELEKKGYKVFLPDLPTIHTDTPNLKRQLDFITKNFSLDKETIVFGHSLGCLLAMRLAEKYSFSKMFLIAGWDFNDLTEQHQSFWGTPIDHKKIKEHVEEIYCISSDNDPYMTAFTVKAMSKRLGAISVLIKGAGHFTNDFGVTQIPELLHYF